MLIDENSSISILIQRLFHLIGVLINYFTLTNGKTQFLLAKLIDGVSFPVNFKFYLIYTTIYNISLPTWTY